MALTTVRARTLLNGAEAILRRLYPQQEPLVHTASKHWREGGVDPLSGVGVFAHPSGHFHYVGFGLPEADERLTCELTFRLAARHDERPPEWPIALLNAVARHAVRNPRSFHEGYYHCLEHAFDPEGGVRCAALLADPELHRPDAPWLQVVALAEHELRAISDAFDPVVLRDRAPLFVTAR